MPLTLTSQAPLSRIRRRMPPALWLLGSATPMPSAAFVALVPGSEAPLMQLSLPPALKGAAREKVALRQAQDRLGARPGALLVRPARLSSRPDDWNAVILADNARVERWRAQVAGKRCRAILPDYLGLPAAPGLWTVEHFRAPGDTGSTEGGAMMVRARLGVTDGFSAEPELAALLLARARADAQARGGLPRAVLRLGDDSPGLDQALTGLPVLRKVQALPRTVPPPQLLAHGELVLDLATDPVATARALAARLRALRLPAALLLAGALGWAGGEWAETARLNAQADAIETGNLETVRRDFIPSGPILDIEAQVTREIQRRRDGSAPLADTEAPLSRLRRAAEVITDAGIEAAELELLLQAVEWRAGGALRLEMSLADFAALDALVAGLRGAGLAAQVGQSAAEADGRVSAGILIGGGG